MAERSVLRLFTCRPTDPGSVFDTLLRDGVFPRFADLGGLIDAFAGRHGPDQEGDRVVVSVWESAEAMGAALNGHTEDGRFGLELAAEVVEGRVEVVPLAIAVRAERADQPRVLRVFRGEVHPGELESYIDVARTGTLADIEAAHGPVALYLGIVSPVRFITVSAWTGWDVIEAATGGNLREPIATRHSGRLVGWSAEHYEVLPDAVARPPRASAVVD